MLKLWSTKPETGALEVIRRTLSGTLRQWPALLGFVLIAYFALFADKFFRTNDDNGLSMLGCGYGITDAPTPHLIFSNMLWGWLVNGSCRLLGFRAYAYLLYGLTLISIAALYWSLHRGRTPQMIAVATLVAACVPILVLMQFTFVSGYLAAGGILLLYTRTEEQAVALRILPWILLLISALMRLQEFVVVCATAAPFFLTAKLSWPAVWTRIRPLLLPGVLLLGAITTAYVSEAAMHQQDAEWQRFERLDPLVLDFIDFNYGAFVSSHPATLQDTGLTANDVKLFSEWFYADPAVFDAGKLEKLVANIPPIERFRINLGSYPEMMRPFHVLQFQLLAAIFLLMLPFCRERRAALFAASIIVALMLGTYVAGRPGITRIFVPMMLVADALVLATLHKPLSRVFALVSAVCLVGSVLLCGSQHGLSRDLGRQAETVQEEFRSLPRDGLYVIWGGQFPYRLYYQPFVGRDDVTTIPEYTLDSWEMAPFALHTLRKYTGGLDFVPALLHGQVFKVFATPWQLDDLRIYFREHYQAELTATKSLTVAGYDCYRVSVSGGAR